MQVSIHTDESKHIEPQVHNSTTGTPLAWIQVTPDLTMFFENLDQIEGFATRILIGVEDIRRAADGVDLKLRKAISEKTLHIARETSIQV